MCKTFIEEEVTEIVVGSPFYKYKLNVDNILPHTQGRVPKCKEAPVYGGAKIQWIGNE